MVVEVDQMIAAAFEVVPQVESVYVNHDNTGTVNVSIFINEADENVYDRIYSQEIELEKRAHEIMFDFTVIARRNRPIQEFVGSDTPAWERRASTD